MATNIKISGNFIVASDTITRDDEFRLPRNNARYLYSEDGADKFFEFFPISYMEGVKFVQRNNKFNFSDLIDDRTGSAFTSEDELKEFLDINLGGNNAPTQILKNTGWGSYIDTDYPNSGSAFTLSSATDTVMPNNAGDVIDSQKPEDIETFYTQGKLNFTSLSGTFVKDEIITGATSGATAVVQYQNTSYLLLRDINGTFTDTETITGATSGATASVDGIITDSYITGRNGDSLDLMVYFKAVPSSTSQYLDVWVDIGGSIGILYRQSYAFPKGAGVERGIVYSIPSGYTLDTWEANGGVVYIRSDASLDIYDINFNIDRSHKAI